MKDLFDTASVPGLAQAENILAPAEEAELIARIDASSLTPFRFQGWLGKRLTRSFGWRCDFDTARFAETEPFPIGCSRFAPERPPLPVWRPAISSMPC